MKQKIIELLRSTQRPGIENLINYMEESDFFTAPCSTQYHLSKDGGLAEHSLNVFQFGYNLPTLITDNNINNWKIVSLLHDIGKATYRGKPNYIPNILKSGKVSDAKPFETSKGTYFSHELKSILIAKQYIELTEDEEFAIYYHNGMYEKSGYEINGKERPLQLLLHFADMWCCRFVEVDK